MISLSLSNQKKDAACQRVSILLGTNSCVLVGSKKQSLKEWLAVTDFRHPLLTESLLVGEGPFVYEYDNFLALLKASQLVYATLLRADNPASCVFIIRPSKNFRYLPMNGPIFISIDGHTEAKEVISLRRLEALMKRLYGFEISFSESLVIDTTLSLAQLPKDVDADALYTIDQHALASCLSPMDTASFELRYLHPTIGFGVFSRCLIKKGQTIGVYRGEKSFKKEKLHYAFSASGDCFNLLTNAGYSGNLCRFVNHAPLNPSENLIELIESANVVVWNACLNGQKIIIYQAREDILAGQQLLVDYGDSYFSCEEQCFFTKNKQIVDRTMQPLPRKQAVRQYHLRLMANAGIQAAQRRILKKWFVLLLFGCVMVLFFFSGFKTIVYMP